MQWMKTSAGGPHRTPRGLSDEALPSTTSSRFVTLILSCIVSRYARAKKVRWPSSVHLVCVKKRNTSPSNSDSVLHWPVKEKKQSRYINFIIRASRREKRNQQQTNKTLFNLR